MENRASRGTVGRIRADGPIQVGFTLNSDTPYGAATLDLSDGPMVIELPAGAYIGLVDDHHQRWIIDMGIPGPDAGRAGNLALRALPLGGDLPKTMDALRAVRVYPLATAKDPEPLPFVDFTERAMAARACGGRDNLQFWEVLHRIIDAEPIVDEFRPMYGLLSALGIEKGKPFSPDATTTEILERAARIGRDQLLVSAFASYRPDIRTWPDRRWEWCGLIDDNADFETPAGLDLEARDRWFAQAIVASPAMFRRVEGGGSLYWLACRDGGGAYLDGGKEYRLEVPAPGFRPSRTAGGSSTSASTAPSGTRSTGRGSPATSSRSAERDDRVPDQLGADDQADHGHDRRVLARHPVVQVGQDLRRLVAHQVVDRDGRADSERRHHDEHGERDRLSARGGSGLGDRSRGADDEDQVLGVDGRQHDCHPGRPDRRECVDAFHPPGQLGLRVPARPTAPLPDRQQQQQHPERDLHDAHPGRGAAVLAGTGSAGNEEHDRSQHGDADHPPKQEGQPVNPALRGREHQNDRDDRHRAERDADAERQRLPDRLADHRATQRKPM
jgi:hypothetical protein